MKFKVQVLVVIAVLAGGPTFVQASIHVDVGSIIQLSNQPGTDAGRFGMTGTNSSGATIAPYDVFCVETGVGQFVQYNTPYLVAAIGTTTSGRVGDSSTIRTLTSIVAWAYTQFIDQNVDAMYGLAGFDFSTTVSAATTASANSLQNLIWGNLDSSYAGTDVSANRTLWEANYQNAIDDGEWVDGSFGNVRIMQLTDLSGNVTKQDQLMMVSAPEASSVMIWSLLLVTNLVSRRRSKAAGR